MDIPFFWAGQGIYFCDSANGDSSAGSLGSLALVTPPLVCREGPADALLVTPPLGTGRVQLQDCMLVIPQWENWPQLLQVTPASQSQSLKVVVTPHHSEKGGWTCCGVSSPGAFHVVSSRRLHCRWWSTLAIVLMLMQMKLHSRFYGESHCHCLTCCGSQWWLLLTLRCFEGSPCHSSLML